jgi:hypothetical protein
MPSSGRMIYSDVGHQVASADMNRSMVVNISPPTRQMPPLLKCPAASSCSTCSSHLHNLLTRYSVLFNNFIWKMNSRLHAQNEWKFRHLKLKWIQIPIWSEFHFFSVATSCCWINSFGIYFPLTSPPEPFRWWHLHTKYSRLMAKYSLECGCNENSIFHPKKWRRSAI